MRISDWSSVVCSSDRFDSRFAPFSSSGPYAPVSAPDRLVTLDIRSGSLRPVNSHEAQLFSSARDAPNQWTGEQAEGGCDTGRGDQGKGVPPITRLTLRCSWRARSEEHTSELQSLM